MQKLKSRLNQKGIIHLIPLFLMLGGIIAGVYLIQNPTFFNPKAYFENSSILAPSELDNPPASIISNTDAQNLLTETAEAGGYSLTVTELEDEIEIEFNPEEDITEDKAKEILNNSDKYYLRTLMWLLLDGHSIPSRPIDPWYALCDHLSQEKLEEVGAEPTRLSSGEYLKCSDPAPTYDQFYFGDAHARFTYRKAPALALLAIVQTAKLEKENKNLTENAKDLAISFLVPVVGPLINAIRNPGEDPLEVANDTLIGSLSAIFGPPVQSVAINSGKTLLGKLTPKLGSLKEKISVVFVKHGDELVDGVPVSAQDVRQVLKSRSGLKIRVSRLLPRIIPQMTYYERDFVTKLNKLLQDGGAYVLDQDYTRRVMSELADAIGSWNNSFLYKGTNLPRINRKEIMQTIDNNWVVVIRNHDDFIRVNHGRNAGAFAHERVVVISESRYDDYLHVLQHEFVHIISTINKWKISPQAQKKLFQYDTDQTEIYGATMSKIYELSTDLVVAELYGTSGNYQRIFPLLYNSIYRVIDRIYERTSGQLSQADFMRLALTKDDHTLMSKILKVMSPKEFIELVEQEIDTARLIALSRNYADSSGVLIKAAVGSGVVLMSTMFATSVSEVVNTQINSDTTIINEPFSFDNKDVDLSPKLNCSFTRRNDSCKSGNEICIGKTSDTTCEGKTIAECIDIVRCAFVSSLGSTCGCSP